MLVLRTTPHSIIKGDIAFCDCLAAELELRVYGGIYEVYLDTEKNSIASYELLLTLST